VARLRPDIVVVRFTSQSPKELLIAPDWGLKNHEFTAKLRKRMEERGVWQSSEFRVQSSKFRV
jgi:radical SAM superfamily enzyme